MGMKYVPRVQELRHPGFGAFREQLPGDAERHLRAQVLPGMVVGHEQHPRLALVLRRAVQAHDRERPALEALAVRGQGDPVLVVRRELLELLVGLLHVVVGRVPFREVPRIEGIQGPAALDAQARLLDAGHGRWPDDGHRATVLHGLDGHAALHDAVPLLPALGPHHDDEAVVRYRRSR
jgi:hypothetical protein